MFDKSRKKFVPLLTQSKPGSFEHKRTAILAVKTAEKEVNFFEEKLQEAEAFLKTHFDRSNASHQALIKTLKEGKKDLVVYTTKLKSMKAQLMAALKDL